MLSYFAPATGIFTYLCRSNGKTDTPMIGQVMHTYGSPFARLSFLAPEAAIESGRLPELLEHMIATIGERGALYLLAEVDQDSVAFEALRCASFAIYARQRIWQLTGEPLGNTLPTPWEEGTGKDVLAVRLLYNNLVPGLVQQVEPPPNNHVEGVIYRLKDELLAYIEMKYGSRGIWMQPFIHPDMDEIPARLGDLLLNLPRRRSRPVYLCVRTYQSWLEAAIEDSGAEAGPLQAVMVKHLAVSKKVARKFALRSLEGGQPEVTAPLARSENNNNYDTTSNY
jgi:hypothetical protein